MNAIVSRAPLDEKRFGVPAAKASIATPDDLAHALEFCRAEGVRFLIARCPVEAISSAQAMEDAGFRLMDTLIYYRRDLRRESGAHSDSPRQNADGSAITIRAANVADAEAVQQIAAGAFSGYLSHYHADPRLRREDCDAVYQEWALNSVLSPQVADAVLIAEDGRQNALGFLTLRKLSETETDGPLFAAAPQAQGRGVGKALMMHGLRWSAEQNADFMLMSTQVTNTRSPKIWVSLGFAPHHAEYTFHKWFDEA